MQYNNTSKPPKLAVYETVVHSRERSKQVDAAHIQHHWFDASNL